MFWKGVPIFVFLFFYQLLTVFVCPTMCPVLLAEYLGNHSYSGCPTLPSRRLQLNGPKKGKKCVQALELLATHGNQGIVITGTTGKLENMAVWLWVKIFGSDLIPHWMEENVTGNSLRETLYLSTFVDSITYANQKGENKWKGVKIGIIGYKLVHQMSLWVKIGQSK